MKEKMGIGFLYITHDLATAHYIAEETAVMYRGRIVEWGDTQSILQNPQHPYTRLLISAVPNPDLPFKDLIQQEPDYAKSAESVRKMSFQHEEGHYRANTNHFVANWENTSEPKAVGA